MTRLRRSNAFRRAAKRLVSLPLRRVAAAIGPLLLIFWLAALCAALGGPGLGLDRWTRLLVWRADATLQPRTATVDLHLPGPDAPNVLAREWLGPLERAVRGVRAVRETSSAAGIGHAEVRVAFATGTDLERDSAALDLALAPLRARLPAGASVGVRADDRPDPVAARWFLPSAWTPAATRSLAHRLENAEGVTTVEVHDPGRSEVVVRVAAEHENLLPEIRASLHEALAPIVLTSPSPGGGDALRLAPVAPAEPAGESADGSTMGGNGKPTAPTALSALSAPSALSAIGARLSNLAIPTPGGALRLDALATLAVERAASAESTRVDGREGTLLVVRRSPHTPPWRSAAALASLHALAAGAPGGPPRLLDDESRSWAALLGHFALALAFIASALAVGLARDRRFWRTSPRELGDEGHRSPRGIERARGAVGIDSLRESLGVESLRGSHGIGRHRSPLGIGSRRLSLGMGSLRLPLGMGSLRLPLGMGSLRVPLGMGSLRLPLGIGSRRLSHGMRSHHGRLGRAALRVLGWLGWALSLTAGGFALLALPVAPETLVAGAFGLMSSLPLALALPVSARATRSRAPRVAVLATLQLLALLATVVGLGGRFDDRLRASILAAVLATVAGLLATRLRPLRPLRVASAPGRRRAGATREGVRVLDGLERSAPIAEDPQLLPGAPPRGRWAGRSRALLGAAMRDPLGALLWTGCCALVALALGGESLRPQAGVPAALGMPGTVPSDLAVVLDLPFGSTLAEARERAEAIEATARRVEGLQGTETSLTRERVTVVLHPDSSWRSPERRARLADALRRRLPFGDVLERPAGDSAAIASLFDALPGASTHDLLRSPWTAESYPLRLAAADGEALARAYERVRERLVQSRVHAANVHPAWGAETTRLVMAPSPGAALLPAFGSDRLAAELRRLSEAEAPLAAWDGGALRVAAPSHPDEATPPPQRTALFGRLLGAPTPDGAAGAATYAPADVATVLPESLAERVPRDGGRFVLPVTVDVPGATERVRRTIRDRLDGALRGLPLEGATLELPTLARYAVGPRDGRLVLAVALLLAAWLLLGAWLARPGSRRAPRRDRDTAAPHAGSRVSRYFREGIPSRLALALGLPLLPVLVGAALLATALAADGGVADEAQWLVFAIVVAPAVALAALDVAAAAGGATPSALHRAALRRRPAATAVAAAGLSLPLASFALPAALDAAAASLRHGGIVFLAGWCCAWIVVPALAASRHAERRRRQSVRAETLARWQTAAPPELEARRLVMTYAGGVRALDRVSFTLTPGITGLLGPNGAGKTTLLRLLVGLLAPTRGSVRYRGAPLSLDLLDEYRRRLGFLPQDFNAHPGFTAEEFLRHWARLRELAVTPADVDRLLEDVGLTAHAGRRVRDFSGGMRRRLGIAVALLGAPPVLIVDEPTTGLDLPSRQQLREILLRSVGERIVLLSTHIASDVEAVAQRLLVLGGGRLLYDGTPADMQARARGRVREITLGDADLLAYARTHQITRRVRQLDGVRVRAVVGRDDAGAGDTVEPNLEEAYLAVQRPA